MCSCFSLWNGGRVCLRLNKKALALALLSFQFLPALVMVQLFPRTSLTSLSGFLSCHFLFELQERNYYPLESHFLPAHFFWACCTLIRFVNDFNRGKGEKTNKQKTRKKGRRVTGASGHNWRITLGHLKFYTRKHAANKMDVHYGRGKGALQ